MRVRVKLCGVTTPACVRSAIEAGADAIGFVFAESPRRLEIDRARELADLVPPFVDRVAVFRHPHPEEVVRVVTALRPEIVQCEPDPGVIRALGTGGPTTFLPVLHDHPGVVDGIADHREIGGRIGFHPGGVVAGRAILLEAAGPGGRGLAPDWSRAAVIARRVPLVLAGGLHPGNVGEAIRRVRPFAVDVSSGIETTIGMKDPGLIRSFIRAVRAVETELNELEVRS